jgi:hypothetical protein
MASQQHVTPPYAIIFQSEHSKLAGDLAKALREEVFGNLPEEVIKAIGEHDFGWIDNDTGQIRALSQTSPRPFLSLTTEETLPSWHSSIARAASVTPLMEVMVSRHFSLLGTVDPTRAGFVHEENERRSAIERILPFEPADLDRWTGAMGFCDLVSLYLCSGRRKPVELPFTHPSSPAAANAPKTTLSWTDNGQPRFSTPVVKPGTHVAMTVRQYSGSGTDLSPLALEWTFANPG